MEEKNYEFKAFTSKGKEIELPQSLMTFYGITEEEAVGIRLGILIGLSTKYKDPQVTFREI